MAWRLKAFRLPRRGWASCAGVRRSPPRPGKAAQSRSIRSAVHAEGLTGRKGPWTRVFNSGNQPSENCLYLNIWTTAKRPEKLRPVMVWIYGGGFTSGAGSVEIYDGSALAQKGMVVVNADYRVGPGLLAYPGLTAESPHHSSGNYGLLDQMAALRWVQRNIAALGGDPHQVTIFGSPPEQRASGC